jgi:hypothetical protein
MIAIIYVASMTALLFACSFWAMRERDRGAQMAFVAEDYCPCFCSAFYVAVTLTVPKSSFALS